MFFPPIGSLLIIEQIEIQVEKYLRDIVVYIHILFPFA